MWTTPTPFSHSWRMMRNRSPISASASAAVGSSMMRTSALCDSAFAISTICCLATVRSETRARGSIARWSRSSSARAFSSMALSSSRKRTRRRGSWPMKMFWATVRCGMRFSSWWIMLIPRAWAARGLAMATSLPLTWMRPASGGDTPASTFMSVDLPAPFSPTRAWTSPGAQLEPAPIERANAGEGPVDALHRDEQLAHGPQRVYCHKAGSPTAKKFAGAPALQRATMAARRSATAGESGGRCAAARRRARSSRPRAPPRRSG